MEYNDNYKDGVDGQCCQFESKSSTRVALSLIHI